MESKDNQTAAAAKAAAAVQANKADQKNSDHEPSGPGCKSGYHGIGSKPDLDNHSEQLNPNNAKFGGGK
ncbi:uncharacterized protein LOC117651493 [Thrips palmi]|uniref:Uncharacterized protein LOC117651493 n=1 Tax=Thrips palmi TaxID=161013 RepID=A0A6P9A0Y5_THRPL|nr:uncharacterized protein LOC117651493 [Thrips palmi]